MIASKEDFPKTEIGKKVVLTTSNLKESVTPAEDFGKKLDILTTTKDVKHKEPPEPGKIGGRDMITTHELEESIIIRAKSKETMNRTAKTVKRKRKK